MLKPLFLSLLGVGLSLPMSGFAANLVIRSANTDAEVNQNGTTDGAGATGFDGATARIGTSAGIGRVAIFPFQLPALGAGETISSASFTLRISVLTGVPAFNGDLYGIGFGSTSVIPLDFYSGALDSTGATLIMDNFTATNSAAGADSTTNATAATALGNYLTSLYSAGAVAGNFVYLRVSPDYTTAPAGNVGFNYVTSGNASAPITTNQPTLMVTTVPEPTSLALAGLTALGTMLVRRRRA